MSDLGPLTFGKKEEQIFLGREIAQHRDYSEATAIKIDEEVRRIIGQGYDTAKSILGGNHDTLVRIAVALLEREVLDANEIKMIIEGKELPKMTPPPRASLLLAVADVEIGLSAQGLDALFDDGLGLVGILHSFAV